MCFVGNTNAGVVMTEPLIAIAKFCGRVTNAATSGNFAWQGCSNQRLISVEEALFAAEHLEKLKQIAGGEVCTVDRKHMNGVTNQRTPMLMTANFEPWRTNYDAKSPLLSRMFFSPRSQFGMAKKREKNRFIRDCIIFSCVTRNAHGATSFLRTFTVTSFHWKTYVQTWQRTPVHHQMTCRQMRSLMTTTYSRHKSVKQPLQRPAAPKR